MSRIAEAVGLAAVLALALPQPAAGGPRKAPKVSVKCLEPGSKSPAACATATRGTRLSLQLAPGAGPAPHTLLFREVAGGRTVPVKLQPNWFRDQATVPVQLPAELCQGSARTGGGGQKLQFEIQMLTSDINNAQQADSVGYFQMRCD